jgi:hypothetical protein
LAVLEKTSRKIAGLRRRVAVSDTPTIVNGPKSDELTTREREKQDLTREDDLPVVARMVVEIRSDGTRTIARGAAEDAASGEKVAIQIEGTTPLSLALSLMKTLGQVPALARQAMKSLKR